MDFKVGDRVECIKEFDGRIKVGFTGTIRHLHPYSPSIGVEWDKGFEGGHTLNGNLGTSILKKGYYMHSENIKRTNKVRITAEEIRFK